VINSLFEYDRGVIEPCPVVSIVVSSFSQKARLWANEIPYIFASGSLCRILFKDGGPSPIITHGFNWSK